MSTQDERVPVETWERAEVLEVVYLFHRHIDRGQATKALDLVADDADFTIRGQRMRGRAEVGEFLTWREQQTDRKTLHLIQHPVMSRGPGAEVRVDAVLAMHSRDDAGTLRLDNAFEITHTLVPADGGWRIRDRAMSPIHP